MICRQAVSAKDDDDDEDDEKENPSVSHTFDSHKPCHINLLSPAMATECL